VSEGSEGEQPGSSKKVKSDTFNNCTLISILIRQVMHLVCTNCGTISLVKVLRNHKWHFLRGPLEMKCCPAAPDRCCVFRALPLHCLLPRLPLITPPDVRNLSWASIRHLRSRPYSHQKPWRRWPGSEWCAQCTGSGRTHQRPTKPVLMSVCLGQPLARGSTGQAPSSVMTFRDTGWGPW